MEVDPGGRKAGRGAYLCPAAECWEAGINRGRLEHALHTNISPENREELMRNGRQFIKELTGGQNK